MGPVSEVKGLVPAARAHIHHVASSPGLRRPGDDARTHNNTKGLSTPRKERRGHVTLDIRNVYHENLVRRPFLNLAQPYSEDYMTCT